MKPAPTYLTFETADGLTLPGLLYSAPHSKKVAIYLHGNGSSSVFYKDDAHPTIAQALNKQGISLLAFNNRGAHLVKKLNVVRNGKVERQCFGMAYEKIKECILDIEAALKYLKEQGYTEFYSMGASTGANKICVYDHYRRNNPISKYVLIAGGDDTGLYYDCLGEKTFHKVLKIAVRKIKQGKGEDIVAELLPKKIFSYQGFWDIANPDGDYNCFPFLEARGQAKLSRKPLWRYFKGIRKPTLVIYGEQDAYMAGDVPTSVGIMQQLKPAFTYKIIAQADHMFTGHEKKLGTIIANWLE